MVPNLFGTRDQFHGRQSVHRLGVRVGGEGSGGNVSDGEPQMKLPHSLSAHLLLCSPVPNRPWTGAGLGTGDPWSIG